MRILLWHGWLLEGSGSNVYAAKVTEALRRAGHDIALLCQEQAGRTPRFIDAVGTVDGQGVSSLSRNPHAPPGEGRAALLRPEIGSLLPVFVLNEYEGFVVKRFPDLTSQELDAYLARNVDALRTAVAWHRSDLVIASHVVPGGIIAARALRDVPFLVKLHGSDLEYAVRLQDRYANLAREAMGRAAKVVGGSQDVLDRAFGFEPTAAKRGAVIPPGVDVNVFGPRPKGFQEAADLLDHQQDTARGRPDNLTAEVGAYIGRDRDLLERLAGRYDQGAPDPAAAARLRRLARAEGPVVAYLGTLIPEKGVELLIQALASQSPSVRGLVIGFGWYREWLTALVSAIDARDPRDLEWIRSNSRLQVEVEVGRLPSNPSLSDRLTFTGRLDHRYAPAALAACDVLVVPSMLPEAFGMVAAEGAASGALPLMARHSGLAEIAAALEGHVGRPGLFGFEHGPGAVSRLAGAIRRLVELPTEERRELRRAVSQFARTTWTWDRTAASLIAAAPSLGRPDH